jgi:DHA1 family bicyclomycin/chloramphenicol resistance-like MFS transporter
MQKAPSQREFVAMMAMLFATIALSIDAMLPALPAIAAELSPDDVNRAQLVISIFFAGMGIGTLLAGPISDAIGRKPTLILCALTYLLGAVLSAAAPSLEMLLAARFLQGVGAAGPRSAGMAVVRDMYKGRDMARIVSLVMTIFALVPAMAPLMGQIVLQFGSWRLIFVSFVVFALIVNLWFGLRQPETLPPEARRPLSVAMLWQATVEMFRHRVTLLSILCQGLSSACLIATLSSQQGIFETHFDRASSFPLWFAAIALCSIGGSVTNARLVGRIGMARMVKSTYAAMAVLTALILGILWLGLMPAVLEFPAHLLWSVGIFAMMGLTLGNLSALAMEELGHIAGFAASLIVALSTVLSVVLAIPVGLAFDGSQVPLMAGVLVFVCLAYLLMQQAKNRTAKVG